MADFLCTTITRTIDGVPLAYDVTIHFTVESYTPGYQATRTDPGEAAEIECAFERAEMEPVEDGDRLTEDEMASLRMWFLAHHDRACAAVEGSFADLYHANDNEVDA